MTEGPGWHRRGLRQRCTQLRDTLAETGLASAAELAAYWPGGPENKEPDLGGWIYCYANLVRMAGRESTPEDTHRKLDAESVVLAALRERGERVELLRTEGDAPQFLTVYPKSFDALCHIAARDRELLWLAMAVHALRERTGEELMQWTRQLYDEISYQNRVLVWAVTTEAPGLPFSTEEPRVEPPGWTLAIDTFDVMRVLRAHQRVNGQAIAMIGDLLNRDQKKKGKTQGWTTLAATAASELGVSTRALLRDWSLAAWLAQLTLTADAKVEAMEEARQEAKRGR